jgi:hypothetical protein
MIDMVVVPGGTEQSGPEAAYVDPPYVRDTRTTVRVSCPLLSTWRDPGPLPLHE